ncbi:MAG: hypothetical protein ACFFCQ_12100 [Promethearchaeota archaeon]
MTLTDYGRRYLLLGLRIGKLIDGYVDSYFGPPKLSAMVDSEDKKSPKDLLVEGKSLLQGLTDEGFENERGKFLEKTLTAMITSLEVLCGINIPYLELVQRLFDIEPTLLDEQVFFDARDELDPLFKGSESLGERIEKVRQMNSIPPVQIGSIMKHGFEIVRTKTREVFNDLLPEEETLSVQIVEKKPWTAYNWYKGNFKSRIDVNTDLPIEWDKILLLCSHEGYPGHHTEHVIKEKLLYRDNDRFEHAIIFLLTPDAVISEGIGNSGISVLFSSEEIVQIGLNKLCVNPSEQPSMETLLARNHAFEKIIGFEGNLAINFLVNGWSDDQLIKYALQFGFPSEKLVRHLIAFLQSPVFAPYVFNYFFGEMLIKNKFGPRPSPENFAQLLTQPILPSDLR